MKILKGIKAILLSAQVLLVGIGLVIFIYLLISGLLEYHKIFG